jgi:GNAT superfamily N-acetyltransferase
MKEMHVEEGTTKDWKRLAEFHYRSHNTGAVRRIFCLKRGEELCGVIVYCYPPPEAYGRRMALPRMTMQELNQKLSIISRVVVHPKYRTMGLGCWLVHETLPFAGTEFIELPAVMAKYNPFAERAGMQKIAEQQPSKDVLKIVKVLEDVGFKVQLIGSNNYILDVLRNLSNANLERVREAFARGGHVRFLKYFDSGLPFGHKEDYKKAVYSAGLGKLAGLIKICGFLLQTKVYLFWRRPQD